MPEQGERNILVAKWDEDGDLTVDFIDSPEDENDADRKAREARGREARRRERRALENPSDPRVMLRGCLARSGIDSHFFGLD